VFETHLLQWLAAIGMYMASSVWREKEEWQLAQMEHIMLCAKEEEQPEKSEAKNNNNN